MRNRSIFSSRQNYDDLPQKQTYTLKRMNAKDRAHLITNYVVTTDLCTSYITAWIVRMSKDYSYNSRSCSPMYSYKCCKTRIVSLCWFARRATIVQNIVGHLRWSWLFFGFSVDCLTFSVDHWSLIWFMEQLWWIEVGRSFLGLIALLINGLHIIILLSTPNTSLTTTCTPEYV